MACSKSCSFIFSFVSLIFSLSSVILASLRNHHFTLGLLFLLYLRLNLQLFLLFFFSLLSKRQLHHFFLFHQLIMLQFRNILMERGILVSEFLKSPTKFCYVTYAKGLQHGLSPTSSECITFNLCYKIYFLSPSYLFHFVLDSPLKTSFPQISSSLPIMKIPFKMSLFAFKMTFSGLNQFLNRKGGRW